MEMEQTSGSCPAQGQAAVRTWLASSTRGISRTHNDIRSRFHGDGVRYKAKVIGIDPVPAAQGDKMCLDSMMKLKGFEAAARRQGRHKQRVWLKLTSNGLTILDERTGAVVHDHERSRISSLTKDESDPRALAYIYQHQDAYSLFYIKTANLADPVLADIRDVCQSVDQETPQQPAEAPTQPSSLVLLNDNPAPPPQGFLALEDVFSPRPDSTTGQLTQVSSTQELMEVFSTQMQEPMSSIQSSCPSQPEPPQPPQPMLSTSQILSMFPTQPLGGSPYVSPTYSPTAMPWDQGGPLGNQWGGPPAGPGPAAPSNMAAWAPIGFTAHPAGGQMEAHSTVNPQPGFLWGGSTPTSPTTLSGHPTPSNTGYAPSGAPGALQPVAPSLDNNLL